MFSLRLKFLLSCLRSEARGELGPFVARLPGRRRGVGGGREGGETEGWEAGEERDKF